MNRNCSQYYYYSPSCADEKVLEIQPSKWFEYESIFSGLKKLYASPDFYEEKNKNMFLVILKSFMEKIEDHINENGDDLYLLLSSYRLNFWLGSLIINEFCAESIKSARSLLSKSTGYLEKFLKNYSNKLISEKKEIWSFKKIYMEEKIRTSIYIMLSDSLLVGWVQHWNFLTRIPCMIHGFLEEIKMNKWETLYRRKKTNATYSLPDHKKFMEYEEMGSNCQTIKYLCDYLKNYYSLVYSYLSNNNNNNTVTNTIDNTYRLDGVDSSVYKNGNECEYPILVQYHSAILSRILEESDYAFIQSTIDMKVLTKHELLQWAFMISKYHLKDDQLTQITSIVLTLLGIFYISEYLKNEHHTNENYFDLITLMEYTFLSYLVKIFDHNTFPGTLKIFAT